MEETQSDPSKGEPLIKVAVGSTRIYSCESSRKEEISMDFNEMDMATAELTLYYYEKDLREEKVDQQELDDDDEW